MRAGRVAIFLVVVGWCLPALATPPADRREIEAREAYVTGRYERALELFGKPYAETLHPRSPSPAARTWRRAGRCRWA